MSLFTKLKKLFRVKRKEKIVSYQDLRHELTENGIARNREQIIALLLSTKRRGVERVIKYLDKNGFFIVPSSAHHHHNWKGGLAQHSLDVYTKAYSQITPDVPNESLIIACLLHDICKADLLCYDHQGNLCRWNKYAHGHGARSVKILQSCRLDMLDTERRAIRWHMGGHNAHSHENAEVNHTRHEKLWSLVHYADKADAKRTI